MKNVSQKSVYWLGVIIIGLVLGMTLQVSRAWIAPPASPPSENVGAPINTSGIGQYKKGNLVLDGLDNNNAPYANGLIVNHGKVGIGTANPSQLLEVSGNAQLSAANPAFYLNGTFAPVPNLASIWIRSAGEVVMNSNTNNSGIANWQIKYGTGTSAYPTDAFYIARSSSPGSALNYYLTIDQNGNVRVSTLNTINANVSGTLNVSSGGINVPNGSLVAQSAQLGGVWYPGSSDIRLKKDITPIENSLEKIDSLRPVEFNWRKGEFPGKEELDDRHQIGLIAQEVEKVFPEVVTEGDDGFKSVNYRALTSPLIGSVKELKAKNDKQAEEIKQLKQLVCADHPEAPACR